MRISYTPESIGDLKKLREFIEVKNPLAAQRVATSILKGISQLKTFQYLGVEVQQAPNPEMVRDLITGNYIARSLIRSKNMASQRRPLITIWCLYQNTTSEVPPLNQMRKQCYCYFLFTAA